MPTIGAYVCIWTILLLLLCIPLAQSTNETTGSESSSISSASIASASISQSSSTTTAASVKLPVAAYSSSSTCQSRTINYITHTLPQQCLKTSWSASSRAAVADAEASEAIASAGTLVLQWWGDGAGDRSKGTENGPGSPELSLPSPTGDIAPDSASPAHSIAAGASPAIPSPTGTANTEPEVETDSPLDNANFLSFEEWKKQNLARAGQSPENVGQGRGASSGSGGRRRPVSINNALDSLGEDAEIELDFGGFGDAGQADSGTASWASGARQRSDASKTGDEGENVPPSSRARSKDAGKTCKERFNYASFDCAATVLKTNQQCKSSSSVLVENKDSYMLNECAAQNKFIIVELCDDILIDTIVLANFEFFSSMFRTFRISVSDRYPVKLDRWKELGEFEARNSRDIQAFLVENPLIWARYLRVEFLSHYGNEYYCPVSLLRVHGTTMMEEFRHQEEAARGEYDFAEPIEEAEGEPVTTAMPVAEEDAAKGTLEMPSEHVKVTEPPSTEEFRKEENASQSVTQEDPRSHHAEPEPVQDTQKGSQNESVQPVQSTNIELSTSETQNGSQPPSDARKAASASPINDTHEGSTGTASAASGGAERSDPAPSSSDSTSTETSSSTGSSQNATSGSSASTSHAASKSSTNDTSSAPPTKPPSPSTDQAQTRPLPSHTQPQPANPTTQESFFKSIHKRLQQLESNSTLSLQYIEEQSRILRDAFIHVEKRQLTKTTTFLATLNTSVLAELKAYRVQYDQLWQSTILELESHRESHEAEMGAVSARLSLLADELVWQKRMAVVQSTLLLLCLGLVLFVRSGTLGAQLDAPIVQQLVHSASLVAKRGFDTPPASPESVRRGGGGAGAGGFRGIWRCETGGSSGGEAGGADADADAGHGGARSTTRGAGRAGGGGSDPADADPDAHTPVRLEFSPPTPPGANADGQRDSGAARARLPLSAAEREVQQLGREIAAEAARRGLRVLATQSGPATPRGSRDCRPSWEEVERAVGMLREARAGSDPGIGGAGAVRRGSPLGRGGEGSSDGDGDDDDRIREDEEDEENEEGDNEHTDDDDCGEGSGPGEDGLDFMVY